MQQVVVLRGNVRTGWLVGWLSGLQRAGELRGKAWNEEEGPTTSGSKAARLLRAQQFGSVPYTHWGCHTVSHTAVYYSSPSSNRMAARRHRA